MRVGYTIVKLLPTSRISDFAKFLKETLILEEGYADNIAAVLNNGDSVNIYTSLDLSKEIRELAEFTEIRVESPYYLVASAVDFKLEINYFNSIKVLVPTEYFITTEAFARTLKKEISQGLLRVFPKLPDYDEAGNSWILNGGSWNDNGIWVDEKCWKDYADE